MTENSVDNPRPVRHQSPDRKDHGRPWNRHRPVQQDAIYLDVDLVVPFESRKCKQRGQKGRRQKRHRQKRQRLERTAVLLHGIRSCYGRFGGSEVGD